ncbi:hypothetical protein Tsubulata_018396 [Turnera subulata]|uniref:CASP-like protein n=1 Tax=Turnera subulata TaxID=218843 RepID=A0A9Q0GAY8_9ROSI|nr:hypothetical protein Tsubulata_018396 [Turnera subulata]
MDLDHHGATKITIEEPKAHDSKGKGVADAPAPVKVTTKATKLHQGGGKKGIAIFDLVLRLSAIAAGFAATSIMGTADEILPFFTQFLQFHAQYNNVPTFQFFTIVNAITSGYLVLSLPFSIVCIVRPHAIGPRLLLMILDTVAMAITVSAASAAASIVYVAHNGSPYTNWNPFCQQFNDFCQQSSSAVVASFVAATMLLFLVILSAFALKRI